MAVDVRIDPLDKIRMDSDTEVRLKETMDFAMKDTARMRSFFTTMYYCLSWGRGSDGKSPTMISISPDFTKHSYGFAITTFRFDEDKREIVPNRPFFLMMYYRQEDDLWETHS